MDDLRQRAAAAFADAMGTTNLWCRQHYICPPVIRECERGELLELVDGAVNFRDGEWTVSHRPFVVIFDNQDDPMVVLGYNDFLTRRHIWQISVGTAVRCRKAKRSAADCIAALEREAGSYPAVVGFATLTRAAGHGDHDVVVYGYVMNPPVPDAAPEEGDLPPLT